MANSNKGILTTIHFYFLYKYLNKTRSRLTNYYYILTLIFLN